MSGDAARAARGSAAIVAAGVIEQSSRLVVTAALSRLLGPESFGAYTFVVTVALVLGTATSLGQQPAVVRFGARAAADEPQLLGVVGTSLALASLGGAAGAAAMALGAHYADPAVAPVLVAMAPAVWLTALLYVVLGALRATGRVDRAAVAHQLGLPVTLLALVALVRPTGALASVRLYVLATSVALLLAAWSWGKGAGRVTAVRRHLRYGLPQGLAELLGRMAAWIDLLVLAHLATLEVLGTYRVAASVSSLGSLPVMGVQLAFAPVASSRLFSGDVRGVVDAARDLSRWVVVAAGAPLILLLAAPEILLWPFGAAYAGGTTPLRILLVGQACAVACSPAGPVVAMSGRTRLDLTSFGVGLGVGVALQALLAPRFGAVGAAAASSAGLVCTSFARTLAATTIVGRVPLHAGALRLAALGGLLGGAAGLASADPASRAALGVAAAAAYVALGWRLLTATEQEALRSRVASAFRTLGAG